MKKFLEFTQERDAEAEAAGANPAEDAAFEDLTNSLRRVLEQKLFPALDKNRLNRHRAMSLLSGLVGEVASRYGLNTTGVVKAAKAGMADVHPPA